MNGFYTQLLAQTLRDPKAAAATLRGMNLSLEVAIMALIAAVVVSVLVVFVASGLRPIQVVPGGISIGPVALASLTGGLTALMAVAIVLCGRVFNGQGDFATSFVLFAWLQVVQLLFQALQIVVAIVAPLLGALISLVAMFLMLWIALSFVDALHKLDNLGKAIIVFLLAVVGAALGLSLLLTLTGFAPMEAPSL